MDTLYHYTCNHAAAEIGATGTLLPARDLADGRHVPPPPWPWTVLVWLTDLDRPHVEALGLTNVLTLCDRTAARYRVTDTAAVLPWLVVRRHELVKPWRDLLEAAPGAMPRHWYVSVEPVPVVRDDAG